MSMFIDTFTDRAMLLCPCVYSEALLWFGFVALLLCRDELHVPYVLLLFACSLLVGVLCVRLPAPFSLGVLTEFRFHIIRCFVKRRGAAHD